MNAIVSKLLLAGDKFMPEMHLIQPGFTYSARGPFTKYKERIKKIKETCFQHDVAYRDFRGLNRRTAAGKVLREKAFNIAKNPKYDRYQRGLALIGGKCFDKETSGGAIKNKTVSNKALAEEL